MANEDKIYYTNVISSVTLPSGDVVYLKDQWAREQIENLINYSEFLGVTTSAVETSEEGVQSTVNPVMINGKEVLANAGDIVLKGSKEFIWDGTSWAEFGDLSSLKNLLGEMAYVDNGTANYTPAGDVTGTIVGTEGTVNVEGTTTGSVTAEFTGTKSDISASGTVASQDIVINGGSGTATYTPAGEVSGTASGTGNVTLTYTPEGTITGTFTGDTGNIEVSGTPEGAVVFGQIVNSIVAGENNYTPSGNVTVTLPEISVTNGAAATVETSGTAPSITEGLVSFSVNSGTENLVITNITSTAWNPGAMPTFSTVGVVTGITGYDGSASATFEGTPVKIAASFVGSDTTFSGTFKPTGSIGATFGGTEATLSSTVTVNGNIDASFAGTGTRLTGTFASTSVAVTGEFTPSGTIDASFIGASMSASGTYTPSGSISATFSGTASTITVLPGTKA